KRRNRQKPTAQLKRRTRPQPPGRCRNQRSNVGYRFKSVAIRLNRTISDASRFGWKVTSANFSSRLWRWRDGFSLEVPDLSGEQCRANTGKRDVRDQTCKQLSQRVVIR